MQVRALPRERARPASIREWPNAGWLAVVTVQRVSLACLLTLAALLVPVGRLADARRRAITLLAADAVAPVIGVAFIWLVVGLAS